MLWITDGQKCGKRCITDVSNDILISPVIYYITDPWQHGIYLFKIVRKEKVNQKAKIIRLKLFYLLVKWKKIYSGTS